MFQIVNGYQGPSEWEGISNFLSVSDPAALGSPPTRVEDGKSLQEIQIIEEYIRVISWSDLAAITSPLLPTLLPTFVEQPRGRCLGLAACMGLISCALPLIDKRIMGQELTRSDWIDFGKTMAVVGVASVLGFKMAQYFGRDITQLKSKLLESKLSLAGTQFEREMLTEALSNTRTTLAINAGNILLGTGLALYWGLEH